MLLIVAPLVFTKGASLSILSQIGTMMIFALSYNMLLGQGGMLSFGHAVYSGLGAFFAIHAMNLAGGGALWLPLPLIPLVGGVAGMFFGVLFGYVTTKKSGTPFAMITLGIVELVFACSLMFPEFFGGEGGITQQPGLWRAGPGHHLRSADPGLLPDRLLAVRRHRRHVRLHPDAAGPHHQCGARQSGAGRIHRLQHAVGALPDPGVVGILRRHLGRPVRDQFRDRHRRKRHRRSVRARCCCSPSSAASASSSAR